MKPAEAQEAFLLNDHVMLGIMGVEERACPSKNYGQDSTDVVYDLSNGSNQ